MKIYISGPITGTNDHEERFERAEKALKKEGHIVINPEKILRGMPDETKHKEYMKVALSLLDLCEGVYFLEGWQESQGCGIEFEYAYEHKMAIFFEGGRG